jgi:hypothetical protein
MQELEESGEKDGKKKPPQPPGGGSRPLKKEVL